MSESTSVEVSEELAAQIDAINSGVDEPEDSAPVITPETPETPTSPAPETPAPETPAPPSPTSPAVPEWAADLDDDARAAAAQRLIESLPQEKRGSVPAIQQTAQQASAWAAQQTQQQLGAQAIQSERERALEESATNFATDLREALTNGTMFDIDTRTNDLISHSQAQYHDTLAADIERGLMGSLSRLGVQELPAPTVNAINGAQSYGDVIKAYGDFMADRGFELGKLAERDEAGKRQKTDETVGVNRLANQAIAKAAKDGRVRISKDDEGYFYELVQDTPPSMGGGGVSPNAGDELSQEEFDRLVNGDPDEYDRWMDTPGNRERWNRTLALASRRG